MRHVRHQGDIPGSENRLKIQCIVRQIRNSAEIFGNRHTFQGAPTLRRKGDWLPGSESTLG